MNIFIKRRPGCYSFILWVRDLFILQLLLVTYALLFLFLLQCIITIFKTIFYCFSFLFHSIDSSLDVKGEIELPFHVDVDKFDNRFSVAFEIASVKVSTDRPAKTRVIETSHAERPRRMTVSLELSGQSLGLELPNYNLTLQTLEYVKQDSLLVATMVSLVCADSLDNMEVHFTDDHFNISQSSSKSPRGSFSGKKYMALESSPRSFRSPSDISLVDIRSYRYRRLTEDYPILQRHLLHYILPLAAADRVELMESQEPILKFVSSSIDEQVTTMVVHVLFDFPSFFFSFIFEGVNFYAGHSSQSHFSNNNNNKNQYLFCVFHLIVH